MDEIKNKFKLFIDRVKNPQRPRIVSEPINQHASELTKKVSQSVTSSANIDLDISSPQSSSKFYRSHLTSTVRVDKRSGATNSSSIDPFVHFLISPVATAPERNYGRLLTGDKFCPSPILEGSKTPIQNSGTSKDSAYSTFLDDSLQSMDITTSPQSRLQKNVQITEASHPKKSFVQPRPVLSAIRRQPDDSASFVKKQKAELKKRTIHGRKSRQQSSSLHNVTMRQQTLTETYAIRKRSALQPIDKEHAASFDVEVSKFNMKYQDDKENAFSSPVSRHSKQVDSSECKRRKHGVSGLPTNFRTFDAYMRNDNQPSTSKIQHAVSIINLAPRTTLPIINVEDVDMKLSCIKDGVEMENDNNCSRMKPAKLSCSQRTYSVDAVIGTFEEVMTYQANDDPFSIHKTADFRRNMLLPLVKKPSNIQHVITADTLAEVIGGERSIPNDFKLTIIDCRYPYEYNAGHIKGAINIWHRSALEEHLFGNVSQKEPSLEIDSVIDRKHIIIYYCEFSSQRAPNMFMTARDLDRTHTGAALYPRLHFPEMYLLQKGYSHFYERYPMHCDPQSYCRMHDSPFKHERKSCENIRKTSMTSVKPHIIVGTTCRSKVPPPRETLRRTCSQMQVRPFRFLQYDQDDANTN